jgi:Ca2+-binding RTX toxin-like protein
MPIYKFSALSDGQSIRFNPSIDDLWFDQSIISAADLRVSAEGANTRVKVVSGIYVGKDILLVGTAPEQLATSNVMFANGSKLLFGDDSIASNDPLNNSLIGTAGRDYMNGGAGNDTYIVTSGDVLVDSSGIDTVVSSVSWNLGSGFENLTLTGTAVSGSGNSGNNTIIGNAANNAISGREGNDSLYGGAGNDTFIMSNGAGASYGQDSIDGGDGVDTVDFGVNARSPVFADLSTARLSGGGSAAAGSATLFSIENVAGGAYADQLIGDAKANFLFGYSGNDLLVGAEGNDRLEGGAGDDWLYGGFSFATSGTGTGNDLLTGGAGRDVFVFNDSPNPFISSPLATADRITDFCTAIDTLAFDDNVFPGAGGPGRFAPGDQRFFAGSGAASGHDESDRVIYDTSTGRLYYDADGSGLGAAQLIATLQGLPALAATDIAVI